MIIIEKPFIEKVNIKVFLKAHIKDESAGIESDCYYLTTLEYGEYFTDEVADAFVVGMLLPALQSGQDIIVKAAISEKLMYNLHHTVIYALSKIFGYKEVSVKATSLVTLQTKSFAVGTGCSLGVDSLATILQHTSENVPKSYKLTHLSFFNVGSYGEVNIDQVKASYQKDLHRIRNFAAEINLPLITLESNLPSFYKNYKFNFNHTHIMRNMSMVLSMQKLFKRYIYSSGYTLDKIRLTKEDPTYFETIYLPALSTENTELYVGDPNLTRTQKIEKICNLELAQKYLYVCVSPLVLNNNMNAFWVDKNPSKINCTSCDKCLRTTMALEMFGCLEKYDELFNLDKHKKLKKLFMAKVIGLKNRSAVYEDVYLFARKQKYKISFSSRALSLLYKWKLNDVYYHFINKNK